MANLLSTYSPNHRAIGAEYKRMGYLANGWNAVRRWNGRTTAVQLAGIEAPNQNAGTWLPVPTSPSTSDVPGYRLFRYRYMDSTTGYVSDPSEEIGSGLVPVHNPEVYSSADSLRFLVGAATAVLGPHATGLAITATTITRDSGSWITDGLAAGDLIVLTTAEDAANNVTVRIRSLTATVITLLLGNDGGALTVNADDTTMTWQRSGAGRIQPSSDTKVDKIILEATLVARSPAQGNEAGPDTTGLVFETNRITRSSGSWIDDGFVVGGLCNINNPEDAANNRMFGPITELSATVMVFAYHVATANAADTSALWTPYTIEDVGDGATWFKAGECLNTALFVDSTYTEAELEARPLSYPDYGHAPPPVTKNVLSHRERLWFYGTVVHSTGTASFTNGSLNVAEGSTAPDWNTEALGAAAGDSAITWLIQRDGDVDAYEISHFDDPGNQIVLRKAYGGVTGVNQGYKIFAQANVIWVSEPGFPESFDLGTFLNGPNAESSGDITAAVGYSDSVIFFSASGMTRFGFNSNPYTDGYYVPISNKAGALSQRVVVEHEGRVYTMDRRGWHRWDGAFPQLISRPLGAILPAIDFAYSDYFHACYLPDSRAIRWWVTYSGDTYPKNYVQLDVDTGAWSTGSYLQAITDSKLVHQGAGQRLFLVDENGHSWWGDTGLADGVPAANSHVSVTGVLSTTTVIQVSTVLPTTGVGLAGAYLTRRTATGVTESRRITSNTASAITVGTAFSGIPTAGTVLWVGMIPTKLKTRAYGAPGDKANKVRTGYLTLSFKPTASTRYLQVRVYEDYSSTVKTWSVARNNGKGYVWPGANASYPTSDFLVNMGQAEGLVSIPVGTNWKRYLEVELILEEPDADFHLIALELDGQALTEKGGV